MTTQQDTTAAHRPDGDSLSSVSLAHRRWRWLAFWIAFVAVGEAVGFTVPALVGVLAYGSPAMSLLLVLAGALEGAILGMVQAVVLSHRIPKLRRWVWTALTSAAAVVAYAAASVLSAFAPTWTAWPVGAQLPLLAAVSAFILLSVGAAQWLELRRHVARATWWIAGTAAAWAVGLGLFLLIATPLWHEGQTLGFGVLVGVGAGIVMAVAMAVVTGLTLDHLLNGDLRSAHD